MKLSQQALNTKAQQAELPVRDVFTNKFINPFIDQIELGQHHESCQQFIFKHSINAAINLFLFITTPRSRLMIYKKIKLDDYQTNAAGNNVVDANYYRIYLTADKF